MRLKIRFDGESEKFYKIFWKLNKALEKEKKNEKTYKKIEKEKIHNVYVY